MPQQLQAGDPAPTGAALDVNGDSVSLESRWATGPTLLVLLRHFGWILCRDYLAQLERHHHEIQTAGLKVLAVGVGEPKHARAVAGRIAPSIECLSDKTGSIHQAYGVHRGAVTDVVDSRLIKAVGRALSHGQMQSRATGDVSILGGTFIVDRQGVVGYAHYDQVAGDAPNIPALLRQYQARSHQP